MAKRDTAKFLRLMNEANNRIAAREAEEKKLEEARQPDQVRLQRDAERREKAGGPLRAREHPSKRPRQVRNVFGGVNLKE